MYMHAILRKQKKKLYDKAKEEDLKERRSKPGKESGKGTVTHKIFTLSIFL
jgi:hypothetical protein